MWERGANHPPFLPVMPGQPCPPTPPSWQCVACVTSILFFKGCLGSHESVVCIQTQSRALAHPSKMLCLSPTQPEATEPQPKAPSHLAFRPDVSNTKTSQGFAMTSSPGNVKRATSVSLGKFRCSFSCDATIFILGVRVLRLYMKPGSLTNIWTRAWTIQLGQLPCLK